jgi:hypothetical protein
VSDTHGRIEKGEHPLVIPAGDVLIHAGDISNVGEPDKIEAFVRWIESQPHRHKVNDDIATTELHFIAPLLHALPQMQNCRLGLHYMSSPQSWR